MQSNRALFSVLGLWLVVAATAHDSRGQVPSNLPRPGADATADPTRGQGGVFNQQGNANALVILMAPAVQEELKLTEDQKNQVFKLVRAAGAKTREMIQSMFRAGGGGGGGGNPQAMMAAFAQFRQENERAAEQVLQSDQKERFNQIMLRVEGPLAVARPEIAAKLGLSQQQNRQVQGTWVQMMQTLRESMLAGQVGNGFGNGNGVGFNRGMLQANSEDTMKLRDAAAQQIGRILNSKQKDAFNKMLGEPFDIAKIDPQLAGPAAVVASKDADSSDPEKTAARKKRASPKKRAAAKDDAKPEP